MHGGTRGCNYGHFKLSSATAMKFVKTGSGGGEMLLMYFIIILAHTSVSHFWYMVSHFSGVKMELCVSLVYLHTFLGVSDQQQCTCILCNTSLHTSHCMCLSS